MEEYILLPRRGLKGRAPVELDFLTRFGGVRSTIEPRILSSVEFMEPLAVGRRAVRRLREIRDEAVAVIDSIHENGPKLVRMSQATAQALDEHPDVRRVKVTHYRPAFSPRERPGAAPAGSGPPVSVSVRGPAGEPVPGVRIVAYTNVAARQGVEAKSDAHGKATLHLGASPARVESLYIEPPPWGYWTHYRRDLNVAEGDSFNLAAIDAAYQDCVRTRHQPFSATAGQGVKVAVIDSGVGPHPDLVVADGRNTVSGEPRSAFQDNGLGHGTHVAGIICGKPGGGVPLGIAPGAQLWSGRVYAAGTNRATNYSIMKAMILAVEDECDFLNLSLSSDETDEAVAEAVADAVAQGSVVFAATGNEGRSSLSYPARAPGAVAVGAYGATGTYPDDSFHQAEMAEQPSGGMFFASFSNHGPGVSFIGPGVGVISAGLGGSYAVRSGTSMACAAVTGMAARLLAEKPELLGAARDRSRSVAIQNMLQARATRLGFGFAKEGSGTL